MTGRPFVLSPSLLSADCGALGDALAALSRCGVTWAHWDVMDGSFVPNITFGQHVIKSLRKRSDLFFDVHLMIDAPERYIDDFREAGADLLCVHAEATTHLHRTLAAIRMSGMRAGVALCPATPLSALEYVLDDVDMVLLMSVDPGFGGQRFIPSTYDKLRRLSDMIGACGADIDIQIDGGVTVANTEALVGAGANVLVSGSGFYGADDLAGRLAEFTEAAKRGVSRT